MKKIFVTSGFLIVVFSMFLLSAPVFAQLPVPPLIPPVPPLNPQGPDLGLGYGAYTGLGSQDIRFTVARIISAALGLLGIIAVVLIIYAGFKWMTAGGNEENAASARKILFAAVIGLIIILSAYSITYFVMTNLFQATTGNVYQGG